MLKATIVVLLLATLISLFSGLFFLMKDDGHQRRVFNVLSLRVGLATLTLVFVTWGLASGALTSQVTW